MCGHVVRAGIAAVSCSRHRADNADSVDASVHHIGHGVLPGVHRHERAQVCHVCRWRRGELRCPRVEAGGPSDHYLTVLRLARRLHCINFTYTMLQHGSVTHCMP